jgi:predicted metal-dependent peptidase
MNAADRLRKARAGLVLDHPFFGALSLKMPLVEDSTDPGIYTDGERIGYNPSFIGTLTDDELKAVIAHEVLHPGFGHHARRGDRDPGVWNQAADYAINGILADSGFRLPKDVLSEPAFKGFSAEHIYGIIHRPPQQGGNSGNGSGGNAPGQQPAPQWGKVKDGTKPADQAEQEWKIAVTQAAQAAKMMGNLPGALARLIDQYVNPQVPWQTLLRDFVERTARNDFNWTRPNRRYLQSGIILPTLISDELPKIVIAVDTSGSIGSRELDSFAAEISGILAEFRTTADVLYVDADVAGVETFTTDDLPLKLSPKGGGGTDFRPAFQWVDAQDETPACLIYLTDTYGTFPDAEPDYPTLWVRTAKGNTPPFGETIDLDV